MMITVTHAGMDQLPLIRDLAHRIWPDAFQGILSDAQIAYMLEWMYSLSALTGQLEKGHRFLLAAAENEFLGYASYQVLEKKAVVKLHKIYVLPAIQGKGAGSALLTEIMRLARAQKASRIRLNVNRFNTALAFYQKKGFEIVGEEDNDIGQGYFMNDYVMELSL